MRFVVATDNKRSIRKKIAAALMAAAIGVSANNHYVVLATQQGGAETTETEETKSTDTEQQTGTSATNTTNKTITDAQNKKNEATQKLDSVNNEISEIHKAQSSIQSQMDEYDGELMSLLTDIEILKEDIADHEDQIEQANEALDEAIEDRDEQYDAMKLRIQYMYENGDQSFLTALMSSDSITDLLNRVEYVSDVYAYDRQMLTKYQETVQEVEDLKEQLNNEMDEMEELSENLGEQQASLETKIQSLEAQMSDFDSKLANAQSLANKYAKTIQQQNKIITDEQTRLANEQKAKESSSNKTNTSSTASTGTSTGTTSSASSSTGLTDSGLNPSYTTGVSGNDIVSYASQFVGNPYVYGGNSLTEGIDCSGFVKQIFGHYGISLPRDSYSLRSSGQAVSYENAKAGDIICYAGHVAIYMGNGRIVHASSPSTGICYGNATYRTIITVRRVL
jgi:cell wall-associated NlpC family hydrolase